MKICILNVFTQEMKHFSFRKVYFFWLLIYFICPKCWTNDNSFWCVIKILNQLLISLTLPILNTEKVLIISVAQLSPFLLWTLRCIYPFPGYWPFYGQLAHNMLIYCQEIIFMSLHLTKCEDKYFECIYTRNKIYFFQKSILLFAFNLFHFN